MERASTRDDPLDPNSRSQRARTTERLLRLSLLAIALGVFFDRAGAGIAQAVVGLAFAIGLVLAGWVVGRLVRWGDARNEQLVGALERIAEALEQGGGSPTGVVSRSPVLTAFRQALDQRDWVEAERLTRSAAREAPEAPETQQLQAEWNASKPDALTDLKGRLDAAQQVQDPDQVLMYYQDLTPLLERSAREELDREVVAWLMGLIQKRMRTGTVRADVAQLASKVAETFGATAEGASLRAALPTLRRSAGLCARCGEPYSGIADACPACLSRTLGERSGASAREGTEAED